MHAFSSYGTGAPEGSGSVAALWFHRPGCSASCGILVPQSGIQPVSPALQGRLLTTGPHQGSPTRYHFRSWGCCIDWGSCSHGAYILMGQKSVHKKIPSSHQLGMLMEGLTTGWVVREDLSEEVTCKLSQKDTKEGAMCSQFQANMADGMHAANFAPSPNCIKQLFFSLSLLPSFLLFINLSGKEHKRATQFPKLENRWMRVILKLSRLEKAKIQPNLHSEGSETRAGDH